MVFLSFSPHKIKEENKRGGEGLRRAMLIIMILVGLVILIPCCTMLLKFEPEPEVYDDKSINVFNHLTKQVMHMKLDEYIVGVVAGEMPASFELEALKAQAIVARTYAYRRILTPDQRVKKINAEADVITNPNICQAWISDERMQEKWGPKEYKKYKAKIEEAVKATRGQILVYQGKPIDALFHASCGGRKTENVSEVWGNSYPYLVSVECAPHKDRHYQVKNIFTFNELSKALGINFKNNKTIKVIERTQTNRVKQIKIANKTFKATELRTLLGLKSTWFTYQIGKDTVSFTTRGYGHGVGLCQYGATYLATQGEKYNQILKRYYQGVEIVSIFE